MAVEFNIMATKAIRSLSKICTNNLCNFISSVHSKAIVQLIPSRLHDPL